MRLRPRCRRAWCPEPRYGPSLTGLCFVHETLEREHADAVAQREAEREATRARHARRTVPC